MIGVKQKRGNLAGNIKYKFVFVKNNLVKTNKK